MRINNYILLGSCIAISLVYLKTRYEYNPTQRRAINSKPGKIRSGYDTLYATATSNPKDFYCTFAFEESKETEMVDFGKQLMRNNILTKQNPVEWVKSLIAIPVESQEIDCKRKVFEGMLEEAQAQQVDPQIIELIKDFLSKNPRPNLNQLTDF